MIEYENEKNPLQYIKDNYSLTIFDIHNLRFLKGFAGGSHELKDNNEIGYELLSAIQIYPPDFFKTNRISEIYIYRSKSKSGFYNSLSKRICIGITKQNLSKISHIFHHELNHALVIGKLTLSKMFDTQEDTIVEEWTKSFDTLKQFSMYRTIKLRELFILRENTTSVSW